MAQNEPHAEEVAWQLAFKGSATDVARAAPRDWTVPMVSGLVIDMIFEGALLRALGNKRAEQSADDLTKVLGAVTIASGGRIRL